MGKLTDRIRSVIEDARWKEAASPSWWVNFLHYQIRLYFYIARETIQDRCLRRAAALTFTTLLALVPLLVVAFSFFRGFEAFQGLEKRAEQAIFNTILTAPMVKGGAERTDWETPPTELPPPPSKDVPPEKLIKKADGLPRRSHAYQAAQLYLEALQCGASPPKVRTGLASLYFGHQKVMERVLEKIPEKAVKRYRSAADLPPPAESAKRWAGYKHYVKALSHQDQLNYERAIDELREAESHNYPIAKTRLAAAQIHDALGDVKKEKTDFQAAGKRYRQAMKQTTDGLVLGIHHASTDTIERLIKLHNESIRHLGHSLLAEGKHQMSLYRNLQPPSSASQPQLLTKAIDTLRTAVRYLEHSPEAHAMLADALWEEGDKTGARKQYQKASQSTRTDAARGFSVAVADKLQQIVNRASSAGLGIISMLFLVVTATSLFSTIETTLNGIWQVEKRRPFWIKFTAFCTLIWLGPAMIAAGIIVREKLGQQAAATFMGVPGLDTLFRLTTTAGRYVLPLLTVWLVLLAVYKFLPHTTVRLGSASWGAFVGAVLIQIARPGFGIYVSHAIRYQKLYGSLGAIPIFLIWVWLLWILVLFGAEVAFTVQNIGLLQFRERIHHISQRYIDRYLAARILLYVGREFWRNAEPMPVDKLSNILHVPSEEARNAAEKLVQLGFLTPVGKEQNCYHPSSDLSQMKVLDVLSISDQIRAESRVERDEDSPWEQKLEEVFDRANNAQRDEIGDMTFHDLVLACEEAEEENAENESSENPDD